MTEPQINTKDVVLNLDRKVDGLVRDMADVKVLAASVGIVVAQGADHEIRLRSLEKFRYAIPSTALIASVAALAAVVYSFLQ